MMHNLGRHLPPGWSVATIGDIAEVNPRFDMRPDTDSSTVTFVPMTAVEAESGSIDLSRTKRLSEVRKGYRYFRAGDVLFAKITPCMENGKMAVVPQLEYGVGLGSTEFHVLRPRPNISSEYLYRFVSAAQFRREAERHMTGAVGQRRVPTSYLEEQPISLPPFEEQHRIVTKIDELFSELEAGTDSLKKARAQLTTYQQAVLKHAFEGKLTTQWRERHGDLPGGASLLQQILLERRSAWDDARCRRLEAKARARSTSVKLSYREPISSCSAALPAIPRSWCWATVDQLLADGLSNGRSVKSAQNGFPVLRLTALRNGEIEQDECKIGAWTIEDAQQFLICEGDVLISRGNGSLKLVGIGGLVRSLRSPVAYPDTMIRVRLSEHVHREYFSFVWNSQVVRRQIEARARTTAGIFKVNQQDIKATLIPLPPRQEQIAIAEAIRGGFAALDHASTLLDYQVPNAMALRQSILNRAFSGQLVRPHLDDEPASALLARIRSGCQQVKGKRSSSRKGKTRTIAGAKV